MNEVTRPATISRGRRATLGELSAVLRAATAGVPPPLPRVMPGATRNRAGSTALVGLSGNEAVAAFVVSFPPAAPRKRAGSTGRMHGEMPVTRPPSKPSKRNIGSPYLEVVDNARNMVPEGVKTLRLGLVLITRHPKVARNSLPRISNFEIGPLKSCGFRPYSKTDPGELRATCWGAGTTTTRLSPRGLSCAPRASCSPRLPCAPSEPRPSGRDQN